MHLSFPIQSSLLPVDVLWQVHGITFQKNWQKSKVMPFINHAAFSVQARAAERGGQEVSVPGACDDHEALLRTTTNFAMIICADHKRHQHPPKCIISILKHHKFAREGQPLLRSLPQRKSECRSTEGTQESRLSRDRPRRLSVALVQARGNKKINAQKEIKLFQLKI